MVADTPLIEGPAIILVADDEELNRKLLRDALGAKGFRVLEAATGEDTLRVARAKQPDVVLLDVMMPPPDGLEVCRQLKADPATAPIPILMVTAQSERAQRLKGIEAGANDFITKPVDLPEVLLRVRNAIQMRHLYNNLRISNQRLGELQELKDNLTQMIIHDLRSPLMIVLGFLEIFQKNLSRNLSTKDAECIASALAGAHRLADMITTLLDINRLESQAWIPAKTGVDVNELIPEAIRNVSATGAETPIAFCPSPSPAQVPCDRQLIERVVINLLSNAVKYTGPQGKVGISVADGDRQVTVRVTDNGPGIPPEYHRKIFEKFGAIQLHKETNLPSVGLGLAFCKLAIEAHGGEIGVASQTGQGSAFTFSIPKEEKTQAAAQNRVKI